VIKSVTVTMPPDRSLGCQRTAGQWALIESIQHDSVTGVFSDVFMWCLLSKEYLWVKTLTFKVITNASRFTGSPHYGSWRKVHFTGSTPRRTGPEAFIVLGRYITESKKSLPGNFEIPLVTAIEC
jgi:hypothetical protein